MVSILYQFSSVQFTQLSNSLWPHGLQHARLHCLSETPRACSNSCPSRRWCHPTISYSVIPFSSCLQSFPASGSLLRSQFFASGGQSIGASASVYYTISHLIHQVKKVDINFIKIKLRWGNWGSKKCFPNVH